MVFNELSPAHTTTHVPIIDLIWWRAAQSCASSEAVPFQPPKVLPATESPPHSHEFVTLELRLWASPSYLAAEQSDVPLRVFPGIVTARGVTQLLAPPRAAAVPAAVQVMAS